MHSIDLTRLAASFAGLADAHLSLGKPVTKHAAESYWLASRYRHEYWSDRLASHRCSIQRPGISHRTACWQNILPVIQEVLVSEPLTRCIAYHASVLEEQRVDGELCNFATSVLGTHSEARHRCLHLMVFGAGLSPEIAVGLNRLRKVMEQFNDHLLAAMRPTGGMHRFCFDPLTTAEGQGKHSSPVTGAASLRWQSSVLQAWFHSRCYRQSGLAGEAANPRLNAQLSQAVLAMLPPQLFDGFGLPSSEATLRFRANSLECDGHSEVAGQPLLSPLDVLDTSWIRSVLEPDQRRW